MRQMDVSIMSDADRERLQLAEMIEDSYSGNFVEDILLSEPDRRLIVAALRTPTHPPAAPASGEDQITNWVYQRTGAAVSAAMCNCDDAFDGPAKMANCPIHGERPASGEVDTEWYVALAQCADFLEKRGLRYSHGTDVAALVREFIPDPVPSLPPPDGMREAWLRWGLEEIIRCTEPRAGNGDTFICRIATEALVSAGFGMGSAGIPKPERAALSAHAPQSATNDR